VDRAAWQSRAVRSPQPAKPEDLAVMGVPDGGPRLPRSRSINDGDWIGPDLRFLSSGEQNETVGTGALPQEGARRLPEFVHRSVGDDAGAVASGASKASPTCRSARKEATCQGGRGRRG